MTLMTTGTFPSTAGATDTEKGRVSYRANIVISECFDPDSLGRSRFLIDWSHPDGRRSGQACFARPDDVVARLRRNIAAQFWYDRKRALLTCDA